MTTTNNNSENKGDKERETQAALKKTQESLTASRKNLAQTQETLAKTHTDLLNEKKTNKHLLQIIENLSRSFEVMTKTSTQTISRQSVTSTQHKQKKIKLPKTSNPIHLNIHLNEEGYEVEYYTPEDMKEDLKLIEEPIEKTERCDSVESWKQSVSSQQKSWENQGITYNTLREHTINVGNAITPEQYSEILWKMLACQVLGEYQHIQTMNKGHLLEEAKRIMDTQDESLKQRQTEIKTLQEEIKKLKKEKIILNRRIKMHEFRNNNLKRRVEKMLQESTIKSEKTVSVILENERLKMVNERLKTHHEEKTHQQKQQGSDGLLLLMLALEAQKTIQ